MCVCVYGDCKGKWKETEAFLILPTSVYSTFTYFIALDFCKVKLYNSLLSFFIVHSGPHLLQSKLPFLFC